MGHANLSRSGPGRLHFPWQIHVPDEPHLAERYFGTEQDIKVYRLNSKPGHKARLVDRWIRGRIVRAVFYTVTGINFEKIGGIHHVAF